MFALLIQAIPYLLGLILLVAAINAGLHWNRARKAPYFRIRKEAARQAGRWLLAALIALSGIVVSILVRGSLSQPELPAIFGPRASETPIPAGLPTITLDPQLTPNDFFEAPPTITATLATPTLTPTPPIATIESLVTPPAGALIQITAISSDISAGLAPVNAGDAFPVGIERVYFFVQFQNMADGLSWSRVLLLNGEVVRTESEAWSRGASGVAYYWFAAQGGWPLGDYEVQFFIGTSLSATARFRITSG